MCNGNAIRWLRFSVNQLNVIWAFLCRSIGLSNFSFCFWHFNKRSWTSVLLLWIYCFVHIIKGDCCFEPFEYISPLFSSVPSISNYWHRFTSIVRGIVKTSSEITINWIITTKLMCLNRTHRDRESIRTS